MCYFAAILNFGCNINLERKSIFEKTLPDDLRLSLENELEPLASRKYGRSFLFLARKLGTWPVFAKVDYEYNYKWFIRL